MHEVQLRAGSFDALTGLLPKYQAARIGAAAQCAAESLAGRTVCNVSTTESGGGVAEMLHTLPGYLIAAGVDVKWLVLDGDAEFFETTKRLHNAIHGVGDPCDFGSDAHRTYGRTLRRNLPDLLRHVQRGDLVLLHDPQSAGLLGPLQDAGTRVVWRSHIGRDAPNEQSAAGWEFLRRYVDSADALVFSRRQHVPAWIPNDQLWIIPPSIDPLSAKNRHIAPDERRRILTRAGLLADAGREPARGDVKQTTTAAPPHDARLVVQVSRWDRLKDMAGVMAGFARADLPADVHLMLAGPAVDAVTDDPEQAEIFDDALTRWRALPHHLRDRVCLARIPMEDPSENATIVNALQRQADVVVQKSMAEGFGLTVAEAMWKSKAVLASRVGGIQDQITQERDGLLIDDPADLDAFAGALRRLITDRHLARRLGRAARQRVLAHFLDDRQFVQCADLFTAVLNRST